MKFEDIRNQYRDYCLYEKGMTAYNCRAIIRNMTTLLEYANTQYVKQIDEAIIREFLGEMSRGRMWAPKTYRLYLQNFKSFYDWCLIRGIVQKNPASKIEKPKLPRRIPRCLTKDQASLVVSFAAIHPWINDFQRVRNETMLFTFLYSGLRLKELINLQVNNVDLARGELTVFEGKGRKDRVVPIHPVLKSILRNYIAERKKHRKTSKWLFVGMHSQKKLQPRDVQEICRKISKSSGIKFTPHMLRHTFARLSIDADFNLYKLKEILGHSDIGTTQIYLSVSNEGIKKSFNELKLL